MPGSYHLFGDSAFPATGDFERKIIVPVKNPVDAVTRTRNFLISSIRMMVEWGNGTFQSKFKRILVRLSNDRHVRLRILSIAVRLNNLIARRLNLPNQIRTVYDAKNVERARDDGSNDTMLAAQDRWDELPERMRTVNPVLDAGDTLNDAKRAEKAAVAIERKRVDVERRAALAQRQSARLAKRGAVAAASAASLIHRRRLAGVAVRRSPRRRIGDSHSDSDNDPTFR